MDYTTQPGELSHQPSFPAEPGFHSFNSETGRWGALKEGELSARTALYAIDAVRTPGRESFSNQVWDELVGRGHLKEMKIEEYRAHSAKGEAVRAVATKLAVVIETNSSDARQAERITDNLSSPIYRFFSFSWLRPGFLESKRDELAALHLKHAAGREQEATLRTQHQTGVQSLAAIQHFTEVDKRAFALTPHGEELTVRLAAFKAILPDLSLNSFEAGIKRFSAQLQARVDRFEKALALLGSAGFNVGASETINLASTLSHQPGDLVQIIRNASAVEDKLERCDLTQKQRMHLVGLLSGSRYLVDTVLGVAQRLKSEPILSRSEYERLYVASHLCLGSPDQGEQGIAKVLSTLGSLKELGFRPEWGLSKHLAARLASDSAYGPDPVNHFAKAWEELKRSGYRDSSSAPLAALSLARLAEGEGRRVGRFQNVRELLMRSRLSQGAASDYPLIASIATLPGYPEAIVLSLKDADAMLSKVGVGGKRNLALALTVLAGAIREEAEAAETRAEHAGTIRHEGRSTAQTGSSSNPGPVYDDGGFFWYPFIWDSGSAGSPDNSIVPHGTGLLDAGTLDATPPSHGTGDFSMPDSTGALCGSGHSSSPADSVSSCGSSSCSSSSCGSASCGSSGCGGGGCGGGGCSS